MPALVPSAYLFLVVEQKEYFCFTCSQTVVARALSDIVL